MTISLVCEAGKRQTPNWEKAESILQEIREGMATPVDRLQKIAGAMVEEMHAGLAKEDGSKLKMLLSYVDSLPTGDEKGVFYALDLGGTNFRVLRVQLNGKNRPIEQNLQELSIPASIMLGSNQELFDYIAKSLKQFVEREQESENFVAPEGADVAAGKKLGFTLSFPVNQTALNAGTLIKWTKGFAIHDTVGKDVVQELRAAMIRQGLHLHVSALVNDTVGTLACGAYLDNDVALGVILGTGTNACYVERCDAIPKLPPGTTNSSTMVINMEWGSFSSSHLPIVDLDIALDAESVNPGDQGFEKLVAGMYLGEIVRRALFKIAQGTSLFGDTFPHNLGIATLGTPDVSSMHSDESPDLQGIGRVLKQVFDIDSCSLRVRKLVLEVCDMVVQRAARLAAAGIVGVLKKIARVDGKRTIVAMDGGLYEHYTNYKHYMNSAIVELLDTEASKHVSIALTKDGSGIGAALIAAAHLSI